jgi:hypothetical protein
VRFPEQLPLQCHQVGEMYRTMRLRRGRGRMFQKCLWMCVGKLCTKTCRMEGVGVVMGVRRGVGGGERMMVGRARRRRGAGVISVSYCEVCPVLTVALYVCLYILHFILTHRSSWIFKEHGPRGRSGSGSPEGHILPDISTV